MNKITEVLDKNTLIYYLMNELPDIPIKCITELDENGCWVGKIQLECFEQQDMNNCLRDKANYLKFFVDICEQSIK